MAGGGYRMGLSDAYEGVRIDGMKGRSDGYWDGYDVPCYGFFRFVQQGLVARTRGCFRDIGR